MTGNKMKDRKIFSHTGYPGGQKRISPIEMLAKDETSVVRHAVKGMLPKNRLGKKMLTKLKIYKDSEHPHKAQNPSIVDI
jgi:large subunit ribosomal protein L13